MTEMNKNSDTTPPADNPADDKGHAAPAGPHYDPKVWPAVVETLAGLGVSEETIAKILGLDLKEFERYRLQYSELDEAWCTPSKQCIAHVEHALFRRATGYDYDDEQMARVGRDTMPVTVRKHMPPDIAAIKFYLSKRRPKKWGDNPDEVDDDPIAEFFRTLNGAVALPGDQPGEHVLVNPKIARLQWLTADDDDKPEAGPSK